MTADERLERYADLVVRVGANVQAGQEVVLVHQVEHLPIARAVARAAFRAGARRVHAQATDLHLRRAAIELGPEEELGVTPSYLLDWARTWRETRPAIIQLTGNPDPGVFAGLDPVLVAKAEPRDLRELYLPLVTERVLNWVIVPAPNEGWARTVLRRARRRAPVAGRRDGDAARCRGPGEAWQEHAAALRARADALNARRFDAIRFRGPGTDLVVGLLDASRWMCATFETTSGIQHLPNIPTEEVFTTPDWRRTTGVVRSTYPLVVPGVYARVDGLEVTLRGRPDRRRPRGRRRRGRDPRPARQRRAGAVSRRGRARRRLVAHPRDGARVPRHALRRERELPHRLRQRAPDGGGGRGRARRPRSCSRRASTSRGRTRTS